MTSSQDSQANVDIKIQNTLISINDITQKIKKELDMINELVKESGQLHIAVEAANQTLSKKVQEMGMNVGQIISESKEKNGLESNLLDSVTAVETLLDQMKS